MAITISIVMRKGGTAKSTSVANLAALYALDGKKVLVVDTDSQGSITEYITGYSTESAAYKGKGLFEMLKSCDDAGFDAKNYISGTNVPGVDIVPANGRSVRCVQYLSMMSEGDEEIENNFLGSCLSGLQEAYDIIMIDTAPADDIVLHNAINAADYILIPYNLDGAWQSALVKTYAVIDYIISKEQAPTKVLGVFFTCVNKRTALTSHIVEEVADSKYKDVVMQTMIRYGQAAKNATSWCEPAVISDKKSNVAQDYVELYAELNRRLAEEGEQV